MNKIFIHMAVISSLSLFAFADSYAQDGWVLQNSETTNNLHGISTFDGVNAVAVGEKETVTTTGNEGKPSRNLQQNIKDSNLNSVTSISARLLLAVGPKDSIYRSTDRGGTWIPVRSWARGQCWTHDKIHQLASVDFDRSSGMCAAVGDQNEAIFSADSGKHWDERLPGMQPGWGLSDLKCVSFNEGTILSAGTPLPQNSGSWSQTFTTTDQGDDWVNSTTDTPGISIPKGITLFGCDTKAWIVVGNFGTIFHSMDKGRSWNSIPSGTNVNLNDVRFAPDSLNGYICGDSGMILMTRDGGYTWTRQYPPTRQNLRSIALANDFYHVYICGDNGVILWTQDGGFGSEDGVLLQNGGVALDIRTYPNPLSSNATIQIFLRQSRHVNLRVFNILGVEIALIANDLYDQGGHSFNWNASDVPNGMYICRLESEGQSISSQMIVLK